MEEQMDGREQGRKVVLMDAWTDGNQETFDIRSPSHRDRVQSSPNRPQWVFRKEDTNVFWSIRS